MGKRARIPLHGRRGDNGADLGPSPKILPSEKVEKRTASGEHDRTGRHRACSLQKDLRGAGAHCTGQRTALDGERPFHRAACHEHASPRDACAMASDIIDSRSEEHTSELQSLMRSSYAVLCLTKKN